MMADRHLLLQKSRLYRPLFIHSLINCSFIKYLLNIYVSGTVLGPGDIAANKPGTDFGLMELSF